MPGEKHPPTGVMKYNWHNLKGRAQLKYASGTEIVELNIRPKPSRESNKNVRDLSKT